MTFELLNYLIMQPLPNFSLLKHARKNIEAFFHSFISVHFEEKRHGNHALVLHFLIDLAFHTNGVGRSI